MRNFVLPKINKTILFPLADRLMKTNIVQYHKQITQMNTWSEEKIEEWRVQRLSALLIHAYNNTDYYKDLFDKHNIVPINIKSMGILNNIPPLTKQIAKDNFDRLTSKNINSLNYVIKNTGGSTGDPFKYFLDKRSWSYIVAAYWYYWKKIGYKMGEKYLALGSHSILPSNNKSSLKYDIYYWLKGKCPLNAMNMSEEVAINYLKYIKRRKINYVYGYASSIFLLAKAALNQDIKVDFIKACITTSEILTPYYKETIIEAFNCTIIDAYSAADGGINAFKINDGEYEVGYNSYFRIKSENNSDEKLGVLQVTDLNNYAMPLINYENGDSVSMPVRRKSNYNGQVIDNVFGRISDLIKLDNGNVLTGPGFTIFFKDIAVDAYAIKQGGPMEVIIEIIEAQNYKKENDDLIVQTLKKYAGQDCKITLLKKEMFDHPHSGKRKYFISN